MKKVEADNMLDLFKEAVAKSTRKVEIIFLPAYNSKIHKNLPAKVIATLKKPKVSVFDIVEETSEVVALLKSGDIKSACWKK